MAGTKKVRSATRSNGDRLPDVKVVEVSNDLLHAHSLSPRAIPEDVEIDVVLDIDARIEDSVVDDQEVGLAGHVALEATPLERLLCSALHPRVEQRRVDAFVAWRRVG